MTQTHSEIQNRIQYENLFKEFSNWTKNYGANFILHNLYALNKTEEITQNINQIEQIPNELGKSINTYGSDFICLFFQTNRTKMLTFDSKTSLALNDKVFEVVCGAFKTTKDSVLEKFDRDGVRVFASGSLFKLYLDTCGYSVEEVVELTNKPKSIISRHKNIINALDYNHIHDKKVFNKFIEAKKQLIKFIINEYNQEN